MIRKAGIWIDTKKAVIIFLKKNSEVIKVVNSLIEGRERIPGEKKLFSKFNVQFSNTEQKKEKHKEHDVKIYLENVVNELKNTDEVVLFGPAEMKKELENFLLKTALPKPIIKRVEATDSMTRNQMVAWVKNFYNPK